MANSTAREFLYIVQESALGTPVMSPTIGTNSIFVRLIDGNSFTMYAKPIQERIPYGGGLAIASEVISDHYECKGQLKTKLYPAQAQFLLNWGLLRINSGQTSPWTTTELAGDLASCTVYHAIRKSDGTYYRKTYSGCKVSSLRVEVSTDSTTAMVTLGLTACTQTGYGTDTGDPSTTPFPVPTEVEMPLTPYTFHQTSGQLSIGGATRTQYRPRDRRQQRARRPVVRVPGPFDPQLVRPREHARDDALFQGHTRRSLAVRALDAPGRERDVSEQRHGAKPYGAAQRAERRHGSPVRSAARQGVHAKNDPAQHVRPDRGGRYLVQFRVILLAASWSNDSSRGGCQPDRSRRRTAFRFGASFVGKSSSTRTPNGPRRKPSKAPSFGSRCFWSATQRPSIAKTRPPTRPASSITR